MLRGQGSKRAQLLASGQQRARHHARLMNVKPGAPFVDHTHGHPPPVEISVGAGRSSKTLTRVLSATLTGQQLKVPDDRPAQINNELPGTKGRRAAPTTPIFHF